MNPVTHPFLAAAATSADDRYDWTATIDPDGRYDETAFRFCVVVAARLDMLGALDAVGHSIVALGAALGSDVLGDVHIDLNGTRHARLARYPLILLVARPARIGRLVEEARAYRWVVCVDYPEQGQTTTNDAHYGAEIAANREFAYRSAALFSPRPVLDELCGHFTLYRPPA